jgi:hypothetical protein
VQRQVRLPHLHYTHPSTADHKTASNTSTAGTTRSAASATCWSICTIHAKHRYSYTHQHVFTSASHTFTSATLRYGQWRRRNARGRRGVSNSINNVTFCLGLVVLHGRSIRTTIGTVFVHTSYFPPTLAASSLSCVVFCDVLVMCCVALFCVVPCPSDTSIVVLGFVTRSTVREELQSHLVYVYKLRT